MQRNQGLDLLRAVAIASVLCTHAWVAGGMGTGFGWIETYGWMGVDLFFVLSGYLIGRQLLQRFQRDGRFDLKAFYRQRAYRILPAYLCVLALYFAVPAWREQPAIQPLWQFLTFSMNLFVDQRSLHAFSSAWSLCVEEHFYLLFPLAVLAIAPRANARKVITLVASVVLLGMAWRAYAWSLSAAPLHDGRVVWDMDGARYMELIYYPTYARLDGLLAGVVLAMVCVFRPAGWHRLQRHANALALAGLATVGIAACIFDDIFSFAACVVGFPLLSVGLAMLVAAAASPTGVLGRVRIPGASWLAVVSYSLYLCHKAVLKLAYTHLPAAMLHRGLATFLICVVAALVVAAILHYVVERPFLRMRDRRRGMPSTMVGAREG